MSRTDDGRPRGGLLGLGLFFIAAGVNHFVMPRPYEAIVPPRFPDAKLCVRISGVAEIAGGVGALLPATRRLAGWGLIALLAAVFPANLHMALHPDAIPGLKIPRPLLWLRLPLQPLMMRWAWSVTRPRGR